MIYLSRMIGLSLLFLASLLGISDAERKETLQSIVEHDLSLIPAELTSFISSQEIPLDEFNKAISKLDLKKLLRKVKEAADYTEKPSTYGRLPEHIWKNTHIGCVPYDASRTLRHIPGFYISASDVFTPEQAYIISEAPSERTENDFWKTLIEANVKTVVALVTPDNATYWNDSHLPKTLARWTIEKISEKEIFKSFVLPNHRVVKRVFSARGIHSNSKKIITHFHYENWPDHGAPEAVLFYKLLSCIEAEHTKGSDPILVHCAAGIGRSGTFVAAHSLRLDIRRIFRKHARRAINVAKRILEIRMQRGHMLGQPVQVQAVIEAVRESIDESGRQS